jgi:hypothetical protein
MSPHDRHHQVPHVVTSAVEARKRSASRSQQSSAKNERAIGACTRLNRRARCRPAGTRRSHPGTNSQAHALLFGDIACSLQCGFALTEEGNILAAHEQWAKLRLIVEIAEVNLALEHMAGIVEGKVAIVTGVGRGIGRGIRGRARRGLRYRRRPSSCRLRRCSSAWGTRPSS